MAGYTRLEQAGGVVASVAILATIGLVLVAHPLFWLPLAVGIGVLLPLFAILADRQRERTRGTGEASGAADADSVADAASDVGADADADADAEGPAE